MNETHISVLVCFFPNYTTSLALSCQLKIFLYMTFVAGEDVDTQRNGIVMLFWPGSQELKIPKSGHRIMVSESIQCMPTRFVSFHFCFPATPFFQIVRALLQITFRESITRVKVHTGMYCSLVANVLCCESNGTNFHTRRMSIYIETETNFISSFSFLP